MRLLDFIRLSAQRLGIWMHAKLSMPDQYKRLLAARQKADAYKQGHVLDDTEALILDLAFETMITNPFSSVDDYFERGIAKLKAYQAEQKDLLARPVIAARIVQESDWQAGWREERRLVILFEPKLSQRDASSPIEEEWLPQVLSRLAVIAQLSDLEPWPAAWHPRELTQVLIQRSAPWNGAHFSIRESDEAQELLGQAVSSHTPVFASVTLTSPAFDDLREKLESITQNHTGGGRVVLACGFPTPDIAVPRSRPVQRHEKIRDPIVIEQKTPRVWFEIMTIGEAEPVPGTVRIESLVRWMAVED